MGGKKGVRRKQRAKHWNKGEEKQKEKNRIE